MPRPEGYRKAMRVFELAGRLGFPVVTLIDTPGAYPGRRRRAARPVGRHRPLAADADVAAGAGGRVRDRRGQLRRRAGDRRGRPGADAAAHHLHRDLARGLRGDPVEGRRRGQAGGRGAAAHGRRLPGAGRGGRDRARSRPAAPTATTARRPSCSAMPLPPRSTSWARCPRPSAATCAARSSTGWAHSSSRSVAFAAVSRTATHPAPGGVHAAAIAVRRCPGRAADARLPAVGDASPSTWRPAIRRCSSAWRAAAAPARRCAQPGSPSCSCPTERQVARVTGGDGARRVPAGRPVAGWRCASAGRRRPLPRGGRAPSAPPCRPTIADLVTYVDGAGRRSAAHAAAPASPRRVPSPSCPGPERGCPGFCRATSPSPVAATATTRCWRPATTATASGSRWWSSPATGRRTWPGTSGASAPRCRSSTGRWPAASPISTRRRRWR